VIVVLVVLVVAACTFPDLATPTASPSPSASPTPEPSAPATPPPPTPTPVPTPDLGAIPDFAAGEVVSSLIDGLRVRQRPGTGAAIATGLLPLGAELIVVMGPFPNDGFGWYLVTDGDPAEPAFEEGWIAAGYEPDPFLRTTGRTDPGSPSVAALSGSGPAEEGPIQVGEGDHLIRWIAADPERTGCRFAVSLAPAGGDPVPTIRATVGSGIDRGTLQPQTFADLGISGPTFVTVDTDCDWALVIARAPVADPSASPTAAP
jgi:hypothetical protein